MEPGGNTRGLAFCPRAGTARIHASPRVSADKLMRRIVFYPVFQLWITYLSQYTTAIAAFVQYARGEDLVRNGPGGKHLSSSILRCPACARIQPHAWWTDLFWDL